RTLTQLGGKPDLAVLFFSPHHGSSAKAIAKTAHQRLRAGCLFGCHGEAIIGNDLEVENEPALSLWLARWDKPVTLEPFHIILRQTPEGHSLLGWPDGVVGADPKQSAMLLVGDPYTFPVDLFFEEVNSDYRGLRVMGGMASGSRGPGESRLLLGDRVVDEGAVGVLVQGEVNLRSIVSQGCRPIGRHMVVTRAQENIV